jgi:hypothetical protein
MKTTAERIGEVVSPVNPHEPVSVLGITAFQPQR